MSSLRDIKARAPIEQVWGWLNGPPIRNNHSDAFWRGGDGRSISFDFDENVWNDHAPKEASIKGGSAIDLVMVVLGCDLPAAIKWLEERSGMATANGHTNGKAKATTRKKVTCEFVRRKMHEDGYTIAAVSSYGDWDRQVRFEKPGAEKEVRWEHLDGDNWFSGKSGKSLPLYKNVLFGDGYKGQPAGVEGPLKADELAKLGIAAFDLRHLEQHHAEEFAGLEVALWGDADTAGSGYVEKAIEILRQHARSIKIVAPLVELGDGADVIDATRAGWTREQFVDRIERATLVDPLIEVVTDWTSGLILAKGGNPLAVIANAMHAFRTSLASVLAWDDFGLQIVMKEAPPWRPGGRGLIWTDDDDRRAAEWCQRNGIMVGVETAGAAAQSVAMEHRYHPVRDYLRGLAWDGTKRLDDWLVLYCGADPSDLIRAIGAKFLISAVARILRAESKADTIMVLEGAQGTFKSSAARGAFYPWFADHLPDLTSKDAFIQLAGKWCIEIAELAAFGRSEANRIKAFSSSAVDRYRPPYGKRSIDVPRQTVFIGTSNHFEYLRDETGNRRFWPVRCGRIDLDSLARDRDQLWAEAVVRHDRGERWWLDTPELASAAAEQTSERLEVDPWRDLVADWIASPRVRKDPTGHPVAEMVSDEDGVTVTDVLIHCLGKTADRLQQVDQNRVAKILVGLGRVRHQSRMAAGRRAWCYRQA